MAYFFDLPDGCIPGDHYRQMNSFTMAEHVLPKLGDVKIIMDLGCGTGDSVDFFRTKSPGSHWIGVDIEGSPEVMSRTRADAEFKSFDGIHIPVADASVDLIFCKQVFEHVRYPAELLKEVARVLKPTGHFVGSTSLLECYHSFSYWNYTLFGFNSLLDDAHLKVVEFRPSIDSLTLILRRLLPFRKLFNKFWRIQSPLNRWIEFKGKRRKKAVAQINADKLLAAGQFCFWVMKK